jgi:putative transcriptional regulator
MKLLKNVDSFSKQNAHELSVLSKMLNGSSLVIGERSSFDKIEPGVVYFRHGIPLVNFNTFYDYFVEGFPPLIFSAPGGFYVNIDGEVLRENRELNRISLRTMADEAGVSKKAIQQYENGMSTMVDVAIRLESFLQKPLIKPINPFSIDIKVKSQDNPEKQKRPKESKNEVFSRLNNLGYKVVPITRCPFDALTSDKKFLIITGISDKNKNTLEKARIMTNLSRITERLSVIFLEKYIKSENLEGTPVIHKDELNRIDDSEEMISLINERSSIN